MTRPYQAGTTEPLIRSLQQIGITASVRSRGTLRELLVKPKDKIEPLDLNGVIYHHGCAGADNVPCTGAYVGESARAATARNAEHFSTAQSAPGLFKSAIMQHAADAQHHFRKDDIKILSRESGWHERGIRESIYIRALSPSLNRNEGRHDLPHCYDTLIRNAIRTPEPPQPHQTSEPRLSNAKRAPGRPRVRPLPPEDQEKTLAKSLPSPSQTNNHGMTTRSRATRSEGDRGQPDQVF